MASDYSVILPARNAASDLGCCIAALGPAEGNPILREVIVVDDGSTDATAEVAASLGARVLRQAVLGPAAARNAGAGSASGELLVFLDSDCLAAPGCMEALLAPFQDRAVAGTRGGYTTCRRSLVARFVQLEMNEKQEMLAASRASQSRGYLAGHGVPGLPPIGLPALRRFRRSPPPNLPHRRWIRIE